MPGKKGGKGKKKAKKDSAKKTTEKKVKLDPNPIPPYVEVKPPPARVDTLKAILSENKIQEKDIMGIKVPSHVLEYLTPSEVRELKFVFDTMDRSSRGAIGPRDLRRALRGLGFQIDASEVEGLVKDLENKVANTATFTDFLDIVIARQSDSIEVFEELNQNWKLFDLKEKGGLDVDDLKQLCHDVDLILNEKDVREMMEMADANGNGLIEQEEFVEIMKRTNLFEDVDLMRMQQFDK